MGASGVFAVRRCRRRGIAAHKFDGAVAARLAPRPGSAVLVVCGVRRVARRHTTTLWRAPNTARRTTALVVTARGTHLVCPDRQIGSAAAATTGTGECAVIVATYYRLRSHAIYCCDSLRCIATLFCALTMH